VRCSLAHLTDDGCIELRSVVHPVGTLHYLRPVADHFATVPTLELGAIVDAVVKCKHFARAVLDHRVVVVVVVHCITVQNVEKKFKTLKNV